MVDTPNFRLAHVSERDMHVQTWRRLSRGERDAVEAEAASLPLPGIEREIAVRWDA